LDVPVVRISGYGLEQIDKCQAEVIRTVHLQRRLDTVAFNGTMRMDFDVKLAAALIIDQILLTDLRKDAAHRYSPAAVVAVALKWIVHLTCSWSPVPL
jgi:hypothetical protein